MQNEGKVSSDINVQADVSLQPYNTLAVPARAAFLIRCTSIDQLNNALDFAITRDLPILILGEGSNTVFAKNFEGLVILNRLTGIKVLDEDLHSVTIEVAAGENWHDFVQYSLQQDWYGLENLGLIPGLVGAAPIQNIGAYGVEVKDTIKAVNYLELDSQRQRSLNNSECEFAYRDSVFKHALAGNCVITSVVFRLHKLPSVNLSYPALAERFDSNPSPQDVFEVVCDIRAKKLPMPDDIPNAGSFFKNPIVNEATYSQLKTSHPSIVAFPIEGGGAKLAAAWLIEQCGWKDKSVDAVYVHRDQALVVVNPNSKSGESILRLATAIQNEVESVYGVSLEIEPRIY